MLYLESIRMSVIFFRYRVNKVFKLSSFLLLVSLRRFSFLKVIVFEGVFIFEDVLFLRWS